MGCVLARIPEHLGFEALAPGLWGGPSLSESLSHARKAATSELPIVIEGEAGSDKEGVARAIHAWTGRSGPYVGMNCGRRRKPGNRPAFRACPRSLHGAERRPRGVFEQSHGSALLLDELLELPRDVQPMLMRVLEEHEVPLLGAERAVHVDVRLVVALQPPLQQAVASGRLRPVLAARLGSLVVKLPPLHERRERILPLFRMFCERHAARLGFSKMPALEPLLVEKLCRHAWPLNVRELESTAETMMVLHARERSWGVQQLLEGFHLQEEPGTARPLGGDPTAQRESERERMVEGLRRHRGNVSRTAKAAGMSRTHADKLLELYELQREDYRKE